LVTGQELLHAVSFQSVALNPEPGGGRGSRILAAAHQAVWPTVKLQIGIRAPNVVVPGEILIAAAGRPLVRVRFRVPLDMSAKEVRCGRIATEVLRGQQQNGDRPLVLSVQVGGAPKGEQAFLLVCAGTLADFEGQLKVDSDELDFGEAEYQHELRAVLGNHA
jgi:hypothetical protein